MTQRPDLCRAVHCAVPLTDMVRFPRFLIARLWVPEYGDPDQPEDFAWLHAYSPYHLAVDGRVPEGTCYPALLVTTGEGDSRVDAGHARKFAAASRTPPPAPTSTRCWCGWSSRPATARASRSAGRPTRRPTCSPSCTGSSA